MAKVENYSLFCEDVRWEANGSPMFVGIMSPVFNPAEYPITFGKIVFVSMFRAGVETDSLNATLSIYKLLDDRKDEIGEFGATYHRDENDEGMQWVAISHLPLPPIELAEGQSLVAEVHCEGETKTVYLTAGRPLSI